VIPYYCDEIVPRLQAGKKILIVAHGNSLRALIKYLEDYDEEQIIKVELRTGYPNIYWLDKDSRSTEPHHHRDNDKKLEIINRLA
jgi:2,3-bisphosphoglycerate-dependent phosphoglycerate mutase